MAIEILKINCRTQKQNWTNPQIKNISTAKVSV
jgi:hypothetical protein